MTEETVKEMQRLHGTADEDPFGKKKGTSSTTRLTWEVLKSCEKTFSTETSGGVSGWTVPLLRIAIREKAFQEFPVTLGNQIMIGQAHGRTMLCASRLTALTKASGGLRPIAAGELIYRLVAKALLEVLPIDDALLPQQFGVGSAG